MISHSTESIPPSSTDFRWPINVTLRVRNHNSGVAHLTLGGMTVMRKLFTNLLADESGATAIEYGLIAALISVVIIAAITTVGTKLSGTFSAVAASL
jgi:pilus assembly protein Flp/PilA